MEEDAIRWWYTKGAHPKAGGGRKGCGAAGRRGGGAAGGGCHGGLLPAPRLTLALQPRPQPRPSFPQGKHIFVNDLEPFIKWLDEAEEEDDE